MKTIDTQNQTHSIPPDFQVVWRNYGHWDINTKDGRLAIRGGPGKYSVKDERAKPYPEYMFKTVGACMAFICDELMHELIVAEGQEPRIIASWNL